MMDGAAGFSAACQSVHLVSRASGKAPSTDKVLQIQLSCSKKLPVFWYQHPEEPIVGLHACQCHLSKYFVSDT